MEEDQQIKDENPSACNFLKDPLSLRDLMGVGATFQFTNFDEGFTNDIFDELNLGDEKFAVQHASLASPWTEPFDELKKLMVWIDEHIYKRVTKTGCAESGTVPKNARVNIRYNAYWEGDSVPFDSSFLRDTSFVFYTGRNEVIEGLEAAVLTMQRGEEAQFVISHKLLFRELGCPPRVKPRADGLFVVELVSFNVVGDMDADEQVPEEDRDKYAVMIEKIREIHLKGIDFFGQGFYKNACSAFEKAVDLLLFCHLANEEEQSDQTKFLLKLYTNLAVCYNKINFPSKTCIMCKEIRKLTNNKPSCKALFQEGRALLTLGEYADARQLLAQANRMEPHNEDITKEMKLLEQRSSQYKENERELWEKALNNVKPKEKAISNVKPAKKAIEETYTPFEGEILELMEGFKENHSLNQLQLPQNLIDKEIDIISRLAEQMGLALESPMELGPSLNKTYTLKKI